MYLQLPFHWSALTSSDKENADIKSEILATCTVTGMFTNKSKYDLDIGNG